MKLIYQKDIRFQKESNDAHQAFKPVAECKRSHLHLFCFSSLVRMRIYATSEISYRLLESDISRDIYIYIYIYQDSR